jgi:uncharacterized protein
MKADGPAWCRLLPVALAMASAALAAAGSTPSAAAVPATELPPGARAPADAGPAADAPDVGPYPKPDRGYVTDAADLLSAEQEEEIEAWCYTAEKETGVEIAVVLVNSIRDYPGTANGSIESFARGLFNAYGIGNMPANDGVLLVVARTDRKARIELGAGYGRRRERDANAIMQGEIVPHFRDGAYGAGVRAGVLALLEEFAGLRIGFPWDWTSGGAAVVALTLIAVSLFRNGKRGWGWVIVGLLFVTITFVLKGTGKAISRLPARGSSGGGVGGFGGGFGGGFSGGGGATGSW